jgi:glycine oxidase
MPDLTTTHMPEPVSVVGAGVAGAWAALLLAEAGHPVTVYEAGTPAMLGATSHWAGGMLAPDCESDGAEPVVVRLGRRSLELWRTHLPDTPMNGSLVVSHPRDAPDLERLSRQTSGHERIGGDRVGEIEPALAGRFRQGLFYPRKATWSRDRPSPDCTSAFGRSAARSVSRRPARPDDLDGTVVDCRGLGARDSDAGAARREGRDCADRDAEVALSRPVRLMHPRWPIYVIPRAGNRFLIGASTSRARTHPA